jgi:hypothetical protein
LIFLNRSDNEGGIGIDKRTALRLQRRINRLMRIAYFIYQKRRQLKNEKGEHIKISEDEKAEKVTDYLLKTCYLENYHKLYGMQIIRMQKAVADRLSSKYQKSDFYNFLDSPYNDGGVGLNKKTAKAISEEMELILILGYGIMSKLNTPKPEDLREEVGKEDRKPKGEKIVKDEEVLIAEIEKDAVQKGKSREEEKFDPQIKNYRKIVKKEIEMADGDDRMKAKKIKKKMMNKDAKKEIYQIDKINKAPSLQDAMAMAQERDEDIKERIIC